tara:strand:- start:69389 stop:70570 length:1182 start_codon:yes stop_codon:yes gene_type:complete
MRNTTTFLGLFLLLTACSSVKRNEKFLAQGNYDQAIELAVKKLQKDKNSERNDAHILLLEEAFKKAVDDDNRRLTFLKKENKPSNAKEIYSIYRELAYKQDIIRPLLPLYSNSLNRNAVFKIEDYNDEIIASKQALVNYLYNEAAVYMNRETVQDYRTAYHIYCELDELERNYRDVNALKNDAHFFGTNFVFVTLNNRSGQIIPHSLENELLDFNTYGLDDFWTEYHSERQQNIDYNFGIVLNFREIAISPERISEREERRTKRVVDGWEYKLDAEGNIVKDENGNPIKIDTYKTVSGNLYITLQSKSVFVGGDVIYRDLINRRDIDKHPLTSEFVFENAFASYRGDKRALSSDDGKLLQNRFVQFPNNATMVLDAGEDIKYRLKDILKNNSF